MQYRQQIYGRNDMVMLEKHNKIYGSLGLTEPFVFNTVSGDDVVVLDKPKEGRFENVITNFTLQGKSKQNSTTGKNLFSSNYDEYTLPLNYYIYPLILNKGETYTASIKSVSKIKNIVINILRSGSAYPFENTEIVDVLLNLEDTLGDRKATFTVDETFTTPAIAIYAESKESFNSLFEAKEIQLEKGSIATSYEPYKPLQSLVLQTPNGLPGIPATSDGNYTDETGQQWICDEIDCEKGEYIKRIDCAVLDGVNIKFSDSRPESLFWNGTENTLHDVNQKNIGMSNYLTKGMFGFNSNYDFVFVYKEKALEYFDTVEQFNSFLEQKNAEGNPVKIYYTIENPVKQKLSQEVIEQYKKLKTYYPTTVITVDGGELPVGIEVTYKQMNKG